MRMFGPDGNPTAENLLGVIRALQDETGVQLKIRVVTKAALLCGRSLRRLQSRRCHPRVDARRGFGPTRHADQAIALHAGRHRAGFVAQADRFIREVLLNGATGIRRAGLHHAAPFR
jgi:hypothetical protein